MTFRLNKTVTINDHSVLCLLTYWIYHVDLEKMAFSVWKCHRMSQNLTFHRQSHQHFCSKGMKRLELRVNTPWRGKESWLLYLNCLPDVLWLLVLCGSTSRCCGLACSVWIWPFLIYSLFKTAGITANIQISLPQRDDCKTTFIIWRHVWEWYVHINMIGTWSGVLYVSRQVDEVIPSDPLAWN